MFTRRIQCAAEVQNRTEVLLRIWLIQRVNRLPASFMVDALNARSVGLQPTCCVTGIEPVTVSVETDALTAELLRSMLAYKLCTEHGKPIADHCEATGPSELTSTVRNFREHDSQRGVR